MPEWWSKPGFNSIASAIGLKSKKQSPSLAIQQPPTTVLQPSPPVRPSLARSRVDSTGPPTPVDYECQSLLSLSDTDPFAGRPLIIPPVPQIPSKKTPLSVDTAVVRGISCPSSSSLSTTNNTCDAPTVGLTESWKLSNKRSFNNIQSSRSAGRTDPLIHPTSLSPSLSPKRPGSSSTVATGSQTHSTLARPKLRARGMTDSGGTQRAGFFSDEQLPSKNLSKKSSTSTFFPPISSTEHISPRVVIQQPSLSRIFAPPCDPPVHSLPATPHSPMKVSSPMQWSNRFARTQSISSSSVSFVSSSSNEILPTLSYPLREKRYSERSVFSQDHNSPEIFSTPTKRESKTAPSSPQILKKAISHQSLNGKSNVQLPALHKVPPDSVIDKVFRVQRTFHPSSPMPPIPDPVGQPSSANSSAFPSLADFAPKTAAERRANKNCSFGGKRLLSHSIATRPSTSHCTPTPTMTEDDGHSVFSLRPRSLFWDEAGSPVPSSPAPSEYVPQPILSPAEVAKLEASVENSSDRSIRGRTFSLLSATASDTEDSKFTPAGLSPPPSARSRSKQGSTRAKSFAASTSAFHSPVSSPPRSPPPPNNGSPKNVSRSLMTYQPFSSELPAESATSLPPPPRSRQRSQLVSHPERSEIALLNLSSVARPSQFKSKNNLHHQSVMKKPSFLEIDDDTDQDVDQFSVGTTSESFLDLARESFETDHSNDP